MAEFPSLGQIYTDKDFSVEQEIENSHYSLTVTCIFGIVIFALCIGFTLLTFNLTDALKKLDREQNKTEQLERKLAQQKEKIETLEAEYRYLRTDADILYKQINGLDPYSIKEEQYE